MSALSIVDPSSGSNDLTHRLESAIVTDMDTYTTHTATPEPKRVRISDRDWEVANSLPDVVGYLTYLEARQNGSSHIWAMNLAWKAIAQ